MLVTVTSTRLIISDAGFNLVFGPQDIIRAKPSVPRIPKLNTSPYQAIVTLDLTGPVREVFPDGTYIISLPDVTNQPTWTNDRAGAQAAAQAISVMIRAASGGGGGGQVDTIVPGDGIDVDSTDPINPIVSVKVDGVTIGFNGSNELQVPAGGGGYVPTTRTINTTSPLTGGGNLSANRTIAITQANGSTNGYLSSADWTTFNSKGDVSGPGSAVDDDIALFGGTTGKLIKSAGINLTEVVEGSGFGDVSLIESTGYSPIILKDVKDGDGTTVQANTGSFQIDVETKNSVEVDAGEVQLVGDSSSPGNSFRYGTNGSGTKGWYENSVGNLTGLGTGVETALGQNADSTSGFVTQSGGDARWIKLSEAPASIQLIPILSTAYTWTNQPSALTFFLGQGRWAAPVALAGRTQVNLHVFMPSTGSFVAGSKIRLLYKTLASGYSSTITDYAQLGASAQVEASFAAGAAYYSSGWITLAAGAQSDIIIAVAGIDGDNAADPQFLSISMDYR